MGLISTPSSYHSPYLQVQHDLQRTKDLLRLTLVDCEAIESEYHLKVEELKNARGTNARLQTDAREWRERCLAAEDRCLAAEDDCAEAVTVQEEIEQQKFYLQQRIKELEQELESMRDRSIFHESSFAIPNIVSMLAEESFRDEEIQQLQEKLQEAEVSLASHQTALQKVQTEIQERDRLIREITEELQDVRLQKAPGIPLSVELRLARYDAAKIRMAALEADFATLQTTYNELLASSMTEKTELQNNLQTISDELALLRTNADSQLQNALTTNSEQDATIQRQTEELLKSEMDRVNLELKVTEVEQELLQLKEVQREEKEASRKKYEMEIAMLQSRSEEKEKFARSLERQIHLLQQQLNLKISESKVKAAKKDQHIALLNADLKMIRQNLNQEREARIQAQDETKDLRTQISELKTNIEILEAAKPVLDDRLLQDNQSNCGSGKLRTGISSMMPPAASVSTFGFKAAEEKDSLKETRCSSDLKSSFVSSLASIGTTASTTTRSSSALSVSVRVSIKRKYRVNVRSKSSWLPPFVQRFAKRKVDDIIASSSDEKRPKKSSIGFMSRLALSRNSKSIKLEASPAKKMKKSYLPNDSGTFVLRCS